MSDISAVTTLLPVVHETFQSNTSASIGALATTVPIINLTKYAEGDTVVLTIEPGTANQATFIGQISAVSTVINCKWTEGNLAATHASGVTVIDYDSATHYNVVTKALRVHANPDGSLKTAAVQAALNISNTTPPDYTTLATAPSVVEYFGQRSYRVTYPGVDYTDRLQPKTRFRGVRNTVAPTIDTLLNGINQYWSLPSASVQDMIFTDDFAISGWIKLTSYSTADQIIASRFNGTSGWRLCVQPGGLVDLTGWNGGAGNFSQVISRQSIPLNKWVRITAQLDMSSYTATATTSYMMFDDIDIPATVGRTGTNPTALVQAGNLEIGSANGGTLPFSGEIAQVAIFNTKITQATARTYASQGITGAEPNLVSAWSFSGNANDLVVATPNNLTSNGGVTALNAGSPFGNQANGTISSTVDYGIIMDAKFTGGNTVLIVQVPEGCTLATSGGLATTSYSTASTPFGFPSQAEKWKIKTVILQLTTRNVLSAATYYVEPAKLTMPIGDWKNFGFQGSMQWGGNAVNAAVTGIFFMSARTADSTTAPANEDLELLGLYTSYAGGSNQIAASTTVSRFVNRTILAQTIYSLIGRTSEAGGSYVFNYGGTYGMMVLSADNAYL